MTAWLDDGDVRLYHGDALQVLRSMPDGTVDCVVTSPPYWGLRDYGTEGQIGLEETPDLFVQGMVGVFREVRRVLADHGTCWVNLGDSYASAWACDRRNVIGSGSLENGKRDDRPNRLVGGLKEKDLVGIPWRVAFALQADGWYLRSDIIWAKPNPMPESVTDRPTKSHEYVFLMTRQPRYWFDAEAVRESSVYPDDDRKARSNGSQKRHPTDMVAGIREGSATYPRRNVRSVWQIATQPYPEAHFATFPEELARRCILAGCPERVCRECGKPSERIVERIETKQGEAYDSRMTRAGDDFTPLHQPNRSNDQVPIRYNLSQSVAETVGWSDCGHNNWRAGLVLDPFIGSGTVAKVARDHQRHAIGIDLNESYLELAARRLQQLSLLTETP